MLTGLLYVLGPLLSLTSIRPAVLADGIPYLRASTWSLLPLLLFVAAVFQLFDGTQVVLTGALRGTGDTRTPMVANLVGYWLFGLPVGWLLCFRYGAGVFGLWIGLCVGLVTIALTLLVVWARRSTALGA